MCGCIMAELEFNEGDGLVVCAFLGIVADESDVWSGGGACGAPRMTLPASLCLVV